MKNIISCVEFALLCMLLVACATAETGELPGATAIGVQPTSSVNAPEQNTTETVTAIITTTATAETVATEVPTTETPVATDKIDVYAQGTAETLILPGCYDFDSGVSTAPPDPLCDFNFLPGPDSGTIEVYPVKPAQLAYGGVFPEPPTAAQCADNDAFSDERELVAPLAAMYVCYRTGEWRTGYLHFTDADLEHAYTVTFEWLTFATPEDSDGSAATQPRLIYVNDEVGFQLPLPDTWAGFETSQTEHDGVTNICFTFAGSSPVCVLQVDVYSKAAWNSLESVPDGYYLGENTRFVFAAGPHQPECVQLDDFQCERHREIPTILAGFVADTQTELEAVLALPETLSSGEQVELEFTLRNTGQSPVYVLKWYTPLEGLAGDIFHVERNKKVLPYTGILATRGDPEPEDYVLLRPGRSAATTVDLATAYDFSQAGTYTIDFVSPRIFHLARTKAGMAQTVDDLGPVEIPSNRVTVKLLQDDGSEPAQGR